jgi:stress-induced morphogen
MATITRGASDAYVLRIKDALEEYERLHPGAAASLYRQNSASIRIRIIDERFARVSKGDRHDQVWDFLANQLDEDTLQEISVLALLSPKETASSFWNEDFENPQPSQL